MSEAKASVNRMLRLQRSLLSRGLPIGDEESASLSHVLVDLDEIAVSLRERIATIEGKADRSVADLEDDLQEIHDELSHLLILIPVTRRFSDLLPPDDETTS